MADQQTPQAALDAATAALAAINQERDREAELAEIQHPTAGKEGESE